MVRFSAVNKQVHIFNESHQFSDSYFDMSREEINVWQWQKLGAQQLLGFIQHVIWCYDFLKNTVSNNNKIYSWQTALKCIVLSANSKIYWLLGLCFF